VTQLLEKTSVRSSRRPTICGSSPTRSAPTSARSRLRVLGTDGFGRSDTRAKLREFFEVDRHFVVLAALRSLADEGVVPIAKVAEAIKKYGIDPNKRNPSTA